MSAVRRELEQLYERRIAIGDKRTFHRALTAWLLGCDGIFEDGSQCKRPAARVLLFDTFPEFPGDKCLDIPVLFCEDCDPSIVAQRLRKDSMVIDESIRIVPVQNYVDGKFSHFG